MAELEPQVRAFCARSLDPLVGGDRIDFIADLGAQMPMRVIGMLLGIPEEDQEELRDGYDTGLDLEASEEPSANDQLAFAMGRFAEYVEHDWKIEDGHISLSEAPGLGVEVKEADIAKLPYQPLPYRQYRHEDGSWKGW